MDSPYHRFAALFTQLGLADDDVSIQAFIERYAPLPGDMLLHEAPFWTASQSHLLSASLTEDADWADVVDRLNLALRQS